MLGARTSSAAFRKAVSTCLRCSDRHSNRHILQLATSFSPRLCWFNSNSVPETYSRCSRKSILRAQFGSICTSIQSHLRGSKPTDLQETIRRSAIRQRDGFIVSIVVTWTLFNSTYKAGVCLSLEVIALPKISTRKAFQVNPPLPRSFYVCKVDG